MAFSFLHPPLASGATYVVCVPVGQRCRELCTESLLLLLCTAGVERRLLATKDRQALQ